MSVLCLSGPALYILVYMSGPDYDDALFFYFTNYLGFKYATAPLYITPQSFIHGHSQIHLRCGRTHRSCSIQRAITVSVIQKGMVCNGTANGTQILAWSIIVALPIYVFTAPLLLISRKNIELGISDQVCVVFCAHSEIGLCFVGWFSDRGGCRGKTQCVHVVLTPDSTAAVAGSDIMHVPAWLGRVCVCIYGVPEKYWGRNMQSALCNWYMG
eukprot:GHVO01069423.1.p1 GENE.GHVO01069423.1~~GHVO01069423.1.p1  ORF type:complete len:213 (+),score=2.24 GHVO01069423.1:422-1060(+)